MGVISFKPYYKWNTFNTYIQEYVYSVNDFVLNLIINGIPSILMSTKANFAEKGVLNLIINGIPSIRYGNYGEVCYIDGFKPYYKWNTFNTKNVLAIDPGVKYCFKPYYKWNTFNTRNK